METGEAWHKLSSSCELHTLNVREARGKRAPGMEEQWPRAPEPFPLHQDPPRAKNTLEPRLMCQSHITHMRSPCAIAWPEQLREPGDNQEEKDGSCRDLPELTPGTATSRDLSQGIRWRDKELPRLRAKPRVSFPFPARCGTRLCLSFPSLLLPASDDGMKLKGVKCSFPTQNLQPRASKEEAVICAVPTLYPRRPRPPRGTLSCPPRSSWGTQPQPH